MAIKIPDPKLAPAQMFLKALSGEDNSMHCWQTFDDTPAKRSNLARILYGTLDALSRELRNFQKQEAGVFVTINKTDTRGRRKENIVRIRAWWADLDCKELPETLIKPSMVVESRNGFHLYWLNKDSQVTIEQCEQINRKIAAHLNSDPNAVDVSRVLRVLGFYHLKDPDDPFQIKLVECKPERRYTLAEMEAAFPLIPAEEKPQSQASHVDRPTPFEIGSEEFNLASKYLAKIPGAISGQGRHSKQP